MSPSINKHKWMNGAVENIWVLTEPWTKLGNQAGQAYNQWNLQITTTAKSLGMSIEYLQVLCKYWAVSRTRWQASTNVITPDATNYHEILEFGH